MQMQLAFLVLLALVCTGLCSEVDAEKRAIEEELLNTLLSSKVKQNKQSAPSWRLPLVSLCRMLGSPIEPWQGEWHSDEEVEGGVDYEQRPPSPLADTLQELNHLQNLCRVLQPRQLQDAEAYLDLDQNNENPLKRKTPYILKRQLHTNKARRPYILRRSVFY
ncbi:neurotensin/neuromedin N [Chanos chanos]|uniref:Neurotensin/neuromedin N n=1 Tax=Chanos chanos TaxID=29144 RepID=A0A6J2WMS1_CHACN|nr:neurotensin/neuromedin N [Chanos chanos]